MNNDSIPEPPDSDYRLSAQLTNEIASLTEEIAHLEKMQYGIAKKLEQKRINLTANQRLLAGRAHHLADVEEWRARRNAANGKAGKPALPAKEGGKPTWAA